MTSRPAPYEPVLALVPGDPEPLAEVIHREYRDRLLVRDLAAVLADKRPGRRLLPIFDLLPVRTDVWAELQACLLQELVLRGMRLSRVPAAVRCAERLRELGHPLAGLPLKRSRGERRLNVPVYDAPRWDGIWTVHVPEPSEPPDVSALSTRPTGSPDRKKAAAARPEDIVDGGDPKLIVAAVAHWGPTLATLMRLPRHVAPADLLAPMAVNRFLPGGLREGVVLNGVRTGLESVVADLLTAAYRNATYEVGLRGGYGRVAVWRSVAGLVGAPGDASVHRVNELAARWHWLAFRVTRRERYWVDQELAVGALSPRGDRLGLLIAHDTD
ncbi:hypothetical protein FHS43_003350 [Streptosporangium becharense]|uniref:Uncharacterized protein n=1 Tax=Streptosporangium becharense TaxID=1816182 RepID=A0A7W9IDC9_9ACTN|nr:DUF6183 family protein [Streptosporangium becharense]MBB2912070.1 hypothetical protein [Streptosporangium becharense]MBB5818617.1 hypothetical protein [Streptosporangium becharense]